MHSMRLTNIGPIKDANLRFGDLTVLVGPQASGKSIALQLLKLLGDTGKIQQDLQNYGLDWDHRVDPFFDLYFGEGMRSLWEDGASGIAWDGKIVEIDRRVGRMQKSKVETMFLIPAQRVLVLRDGWPRPFGDYASGDPYVVRAFSEGLRMLMEKEIDTTQVIFPKSNQLKAGYRNALQRTMFGSFELGVDRARSQKRLVLRGKEQDALPYMVWSAGQREFVPLLLGMYRLMPPSKVSRRDKLQWVIIEEPEMGLHPRAISTVLLLVLELLQRDYRVCLSTHSPQVLELVWALRMLGGNGGNVKDLLGVFGVERSDVQLRKVAAAALTKETCVYYFDENGHTHDISLLDSWGSDDAMASWGGMLEFSSRVNETVARVVANNNVPAASERGQS
ncbi:MAG: ATP-binding protein [Bacteroidetes bacterium]|nr:ATP-binding protein [Bacteroidota bacterium]